MVMINNEVGFNLEYQKLQDEIMKYNNEYSALIVDYDELINVVTPNIENRYMIVLGRKEYDLFVLQLEMRQIKHEISLYQTAINQGKKANKAEIDKIIETEFAEYRTHIEELINKLHAAEMSVNLEFLSTKDSQEIKKLYRKLVQKIHPDLNPNLPEQAVALWHKVVKAYSLGQWQELYLYNDMADELLGGIKIKIDNNMENLLDQCKQIKDKINKLKVHIDNVNKKVPLSYINILDSPQKVAEKRDELDSTISQSREQLEIIKKIRDDVMGRAI